MLAYDNPFVTPVHNLVSSLVYSALGNEPETVIIDGRIVMQNREMRTVDESEVMAVSTAAGNLTHAAGTDRLVTERGWRSCAF